jgi:hypothetical protein
VANSRISDCTVPKSNSVCGMAARLRSQRQVAAMNNFALHRGFRPSHLAHLATQSQMTLGRRPRCARSGRSRRLSWERSTRSALSAGMSDLSSTRTNRLHSTFHIDHYVNPKRPLPEPASKLIGSLLIPHQSRMLFAYAWQLRRPAADVRNRRNPDGRPSWSDPASFSSDRHQFHLLVKNDCRPYLTLRS